MPVVQLDAATLLLPVSVRFDMQARLATLLTSLNNTPGIDVSGLQVVVASTKGFNTPVTGVRVGRVVDTMRSRRRQLPETFDPPTPIG